MSDLRKCYHGRRVLGGGCEIRSGLISALEISKLAVLDVQASLKLANHSPTGFEWGYGGSGAAQTALAILLDFTGNADLALEHYQQFKWDVVVLFPREGWVLVGDEIDLWLKDRETARQIFAVKYSAPALAEPAIADDEGDKSFFSE